MSYTAWIFTAERHYFACCALSLVLGACSFDGTNDASTDPIAAKSATQPFIIKGVPGTTVEVGTTYRYVPAAFAGITRVLSYQIANKPQWATFSETSGELSGTPNECDAGMTGEIEIGATDGTQHASVGPFRIIVVPQRLRPGSPPSAPPIIAGTPAPTVSAGQAYKFSPVVNDPSGGRLSFSIVNRPVWTAFNTATGSLTGTPTNANVGSYADIVISVSTDGAPVSLPPFFIQVQPAGEGVPTISGDPPTTVGAGSSYSFTPVASSADGNELSFSIHNAPSWASFSATSGELSGTPTAANVGSYAGIVISVSDGSASVSLPAFAIEVTQIATTKAQALLSYMTSLSGSKILSGQYADYLVPGMMDQVPLISSSTGKTPAILGTFLSLESATFNADPIALSNQWLAKGGIVLTMLSPGNPTHSATIIGGITQSALRPHGYAVNFNNILVPGTVEYARWQAFLDLLVTDFKRINGPIIVRPFPELNSTWTWWGSQPPAQFIALWRQMVTHMRAAGVSNVLWCFNVGDTVVPPTFADGTPTGFANLGDVVRAYYPGGDYTDVVSIDAYPPSVAKDGAGIAALTATGKPVIFAEMGAVTGPIPVPLHSGDTGAALAALLANFPQVVAAVVWSGTEALPVQNGMDAFMNNPKIVDLSSLPPNL